jgi:hypothetical protein
MDRQGRLGQGGISAGRREHVRARVRPRWNWRPPLSLGAGRFQPREAGIRTGLIRVGGWYYGGVCDIAAAALRERAQARLLCELFKAMAPSAQCTFIAREIEPRLEAGLATRWRERMGPSGS